MTKFELRWDYKGYQMGARLVSCSSKDWNQTLITRINQLSAQVHKNSMTGGATVLDVAEPLRGLFESLEYYNTKTQKLGNRYIVNFHNDLPDVVLVHNHAENIVGTVYVYNLDMNDFRHVEKQTNVSPKKAFLEGLSGHVKGNLQYIKPKAKHKNYKYLLI